MSVLESGPWIGGEEVRTGHTEEVRDPYHGDVVGVVHLAGADEVSRALDLADRAFRDRVAELPLYKKIEILERAAQLLEEQKESFTQLIVKEVAKPYSLALGEVKRGIVNIKSAVAFLYQIRGESLPLDFHPQATGKWGIVRRFPVGPVLAITPFNFPLNLALHKILPGVVAGTPIILKPPPQAPLTAIRLGQLFIEAGWPPEALSVVPTTNELAETMVRDERIALLTFTGSAKVGWYLKSIAGRKKVLLELGGNAGVIVHEDADLDQAARKIAKGGFLYSGQICISVQRVFVHTSIYEPFREKLKSFVAQLKVGDPQDPETDLSCQVSDREADRAWAWIQEALEAGAKPWPDPPKREGRTLYPVIFENVPESAKIWDEEAFAPLVCLKPYQTFEEALEGVNRTKYGLQAGVFTQNLSLALQAFETLQVGGVMINESPTFRVDPMPYGGIKASGLGREGIAYAYLEYTEPRLLVIKGM